MGRINKNIKNAMKEAIKKQRSVGQIICLDGGTDNHNRADWAKNTLLIASGNISVLTAVGEYVAKNKAVTFNPTIESVIVFDVADSLFKVVPKETYNTEFSENQFFCGHINGPKKMFTLELKLKERKQGQFFNLDRNAFPFLNLKNRSLDFNGENWYIMWDDNFAKLSNNTQVPFPAGVSTTYLHFDKTKLTLELMDSAKHKLHETTDNNVYMGFFHLNIQEATFPVARNHQKISFFGDSIWTFTGHTATGNTVYYPAQSTPGNHLTYFSEMAFSRIASALGSVCVNNSFSGSRISLTNPNETTLKLNDVIKATQNAAGVVSPESTIKVIDALAPISKVVDTIVTGAPLLNSACTVDTKVTGCGNPGATVTVTFKDAKTATSVVDAKGNWSVDVPLGSPAQPGINTLNRIQKVVKADGTKPDMIIVSQGVNDYLNNVKLYDTELAAGVGKDRAFDFAYRKLLTELQALCPEATIVLTSIGRFNSWSGNASLVIPNAYGKKPEDYNAVIKKISEDFGCVYIDLYENTGISKTNAATFFVDNLHPNRKGQQLIANRIINYLKQEF